jgi:diguanylate cyclase (GGDEF)-like protein
VSCAYRDEAVVPQSGVLELSRDTFRAIRPVRGVWEVYPGEALTPKEFVEPHLPRHATVPPPYGRYYTAEGTRHLSGPTTYRLTLENVPTVPLLGFRLPAMYGSYSLWINGTPLSGRVVPLHPDDNGSVELIVHSSRSYYPFGGLSSYPPFLGPFNSLNRYTMVRLFRDGILIGALVLLGLYHLLLTLGPNRDAPTLTLSGLLFFLALHLFVSGGEMAFTTLVSISAPAYTRLMGLALYPLVPLYLRFLRGLFPLEVGGRRAVMVERLLWVWLGASFLVPLRWWMDLLYAGIVVIIAGLIMVIRGLVRSFRSRRSGSLLAVSGLLLLAAAFFLELGGITCIVPLGESIPGYGFVLFAGFNSLAVFLRIVDFRISLSNLKEQAQHDGLTGLYNRRTMDARLEEEYVRHGRAGRPLAVLMLDVDRFKEYNDTKGHQAGDDVLKRIAGVLDGHARRAGDTASRYGGEEFALILPHTDIQGAYSLAESIRRSVEEQSIPHPGSPAGVVTVSIGVTSGIPGQPARPESLCRAADVALYDAKKSGRNAVRTATATATSTATADSTATATAAPGVSDTIEQG